MIQKLVYSMELNDVDISCCNFSYVYEQRNISKVHEIAIDEDEVYSSKEACNFLLLEDYYLCFAWNKLYKKYLFKDISYPVGKINEDEYWSWKAVSRANGVVCSETVVYNYLQRNNSIMHSDKYNPLFVIEAKSEMCDYIDEKYPEISDICREDFIYTCLFQALRTKNILGKDKTKLYIPQIKSYAKKYKPSKKYFKSLPIKKKIRLISISNCFGLVCNLQNALNIGNKSNIG